MVTGDELSGLIDIVLNERKRIVHPRDGDNRWCEQDHREIARRGIEAGLKLALRLLTEQAAPAGTRRT